MSNEPIQILGRIEKVDRERRFAFVKPMVALPSYVDTGRGPDLFWGFGDDPVPDLKKIGQFLIGPGKQNWQVIAVIAWQDGTPVKKTTPQKPVVPQSDYPYAKTAECFVHPYNFVSLPSHIPVSNRDRSCPHDRLETNLQSGKLTCLLETKTDWFIPHAFKISVDQKHKTLGYFTLEEVDSQNKYDPDSDHSQPAIPASSLRGMVRSIYEAATLSCFSITDLATLDFRVAFPPEDPPAGKEWYDIDTQVRYIPARVVKKQDDGSLTVRLLKSRFRDDEIDVKPRIRTAKHPGLEPPVIRCGLIEAYPGGPIGSTSVWDALIRDDRNHPVLDGSPVVAVIDADAKAYISPRNGKHKFDYYQVLFAQHLLSRDSLVAHKSTIESHADPLHPKRVIFGYLHRTGNNMNGKHWERVCFDPNAAYNDPDQFAADGTQQSLEERYDQFVNEELSDDSPDLRLASRLVVNKAMDALKSYAKRNGEKAKEQRTPPFPSGGRVLISDFVQERPDLVKIKEGDLFYALIDESNSDQNQQLRGLYPICVMRLSYDDSVGDLIPRDFFPCGRYHEICSAPDCFGDSGELCDKCRNRHECLCPACRVFGWTRDSDADLQPHAKRVDAVAGHIRFSHGTFVGEWDYKTQIFETTLLPILGSPKPTTTRFYLRKLYNEENADEVSTAHTGRWPQALEKEKYPFYRKSEATIRGRKLYRRREAVIPASDDLAIGGLSDPQGKPGNQNQTVTLLPDKMSFAFDVYFANLTPFELGALIFSLELQVPDSWKSDLIDDENVQLRHSIGHGKPLGMGACEIKIDQIQFDDFSTDSNRNRYAQYKPFATTGQSQTSDVSQSNKQTPCKNVVIDEALHEFVTWWQVMEKAWTHKTEHGPRQTRIDLLEMLRSQPPSGPMHYPPKVDEKARAAEQALVHHEKNFTWFVANKKGHHDLPTPIEERSGKKRLPYKPNK